MIYVDFIMLRAAYRGFQKWNSKRKDRKEIREKNIKYNIEINKITPTLDILNELINTVNSWKVTTICVPHTSLQDAAWHERNEMVDRFVNRLQYYIKEESYKCENRCALND